MVEQNTENVWVIGSSPILGGSFGFGESIKRAVLIIHARDMLAYRICPVQVSNVLKFAQLVLCSSKHTIDELESY